MSQLPSAESDLGQTTFAIFNEGPDTEALTIPDARLLFSGDFKRSNSDLILTDEAGQRALVVDYFRHDKLPDLASPEGARLRGDVVKLLAGPLAPDQYAQAGAPAPAPSAQVIGKVDKVSGSATVLRNGAVITLNVGDQLLKGDVVQTGSNSILGISFADGTALNLTASTRMALNEFIYDANSNTNSGLLSLVQGGFAFIAGQVAHTGGLNISTPVATMGIRGTAGGASCADAGNCQFFASTNPDGSLSVYQLTPIGGGAALRVEVGTIAQVSATGQYTFAPATDLNPAVANLMTQLVNDYPQIIQNLVTPPPSPPAPTTPNDNPSGDRTDSGSSKGSSVTVAVDVPASITSVATSGLPQPASSDAAPPVIVTITSLATPPPLATPTEPPLPLPVIVPNPIANQSAPEGAAWSLTIPASTFSDATLPLAVTLASGAPLASVGLSFNPETRTISGTLPADFNGPIVIVVTAGSSGVSDVFTLNVTPVNDAPTVVGGPVSLAPIAEGTAAPPGELVSTLLGGSFSDARDQVVGGSQANVLAGIAVSGNAATTQGTWQYFNGATWVAIPGNVSESNALLLSAGTLLRFVPAENFSGAAPALTVHLVDDSSGPITTGTFVNLVGNTGGTSPYSAATVTVSETVTPVNDPPTTTPVTLAPIAEDSGARLITQAELLANATDPDGDALTAINLAIQSGGGSLVNNGNGTWSYTPAPNDDTSVTFSYSITDGVVPVATTATLDITPVNDPPTTTPVTLAPIAEDSGARLITQAELLANAADPEGDALTAINLAIQSGGGSLVNNGNGTWSYTPAPNDDTSVTFSYSVTDGTTPVATTATLDITPTGDPPTTTPVTLAPIAEDSGARLITQAELLANAADPDGNPLTAINLAIQSGGGSLVNNGNGTWSYTPAPNDDTSVTFSYSITDGTTPVATTATLDITPVNDPPTTTPVTLAPIAEDSGARLITQAQLLVNASDLDGNPLTAINLAIQSGGGSLVNNGNGTWSYTPAPNDDTSVTFSYSITDGITPVATTATLDITPVPDAPVIAEGNVVFAVSEGDIGVHRGTFHATDAENDPLTWSVVGGSPVSADYFVTLDDLSITKNGSPIFHDGFDGGGAPPSAPYFSSGTAASYFVDGSFIEDLDNGRLVMAGRQGAAFLSLQTGAQATHHTALLNTNAQPLNVSQLGLKSNSSFEVAARFDLSLPQDPREAYGIQLVDSIGDQTPGVHDNDIVGLMVRRSEVPGGPVEVVLIHIDRQTGEFRIDERIVLQPPEGADQIVLHLTHDASQPGVIHASFDFYSNGAPIPESTVEFTTTETIFNGEDWTRAQIVTTEQAENVSVYVSDYGVLYVDQQGNWQYNLRNGLPAVQQLGEGDSIVDHFVVQVSDGNGGTTTRNIDVTVNGVNDAPTITGDLAIPVNQGGSVVLTSADFQAVDPDNTAGELTYTVSDATHGHVAFANAPGTAITTFTQAQLNAGLVVFVHDGSSTSTSQATFKVTVSDGMASSAATTIVAAVSTITVQVLTANGLDFESDDPINKMGTGILQPGDATGFTIINAAANRKFVFEGAGFTYGGDSETGYTVTGGTIFVIHVLTLDDIPIADLSGQIDAATFYDAVVGEAQGDHTFTELSSQWNIRFVGGAGNDAFSASDNNDFFRSSGGNDLFDGGFGFDRANYADAPGRIVVQLANGTVAKYNAAGTTIISTDTLRSIEFVTGTNFNDTFNATGFDKNSANSGSTVTSNTNGAFNEFEGRGGNDVITGNGATRISYLHATAGVVVDFAIGTADGDASVGHDTFTGVNGVRGSYFDDFLYGSNNNQAGTFQSFEGRGGNDYIDGRGGFDRAVYGNEDAGITVQLAAGIVTGGPNTGTDTLRSVEAIAGTDFADVYDASGFTASDAVSPSANSGNGGVVNGVGGLPSNFNEFEGRGGNDTVTGNGNTRVAYTSALAGVTVMLGVNGSGSAFSTGSSVFGDVAGVGTDNFVSGVSRVRGSEFGDIITGNGGNNTLEGQGGNDVLSGLGGSDTLIGGTGADIFVYTNGGLTGGADVVTDFNPSEGDRIDLRALTAIASVGDLTWAQVGNDTVITFAGSGNTLTLQNTVLAELTDKDFIFSGQVAITVQTPDGYDFSTLYDDLVGAGGFGDIVLVDSTHFKATNAERGLVFLVTFSGANPLVGTITAIDIYDLSGHLLVTTNGWNIGVQDLYDALSIYVDTEGDTTALNDIFASYSYSAVGNFSASGEFDYSSVNFGGDTFFSGTGNDYFNGLTNANGDFGHGDTVDYSLVPPLEGDLGVTVDLTQVGPQDTVAGGIDTLVNIENVRGSAYDDTLIGNGMNSVIEGGLGNDVLIGGPGGRETVSYEHAPSYVVVSLLQTEQQDTLGAGLDTISGFEVLRGSAYGDTLIGNGNSVLEGGAGGDHLIGQVEGSDTASYEHAAAGVTVSLASPELNTGDAAGDTFTFIANLIGSRFNDTLIGDANDNVLNGFGSQGSGSDFLTGGLGADTFVFGGGRVTVTDFNQAEGDKIDLSFLNFGAGITEDALSGLLASSQGNTINFGNGQVLTLNVNVSVLQQSDFILQH